MTQSNLAMAEIRKRPSLASLPVIAVDECQKTVSNICAQRLNLATIITATVQATYKNQARTIKALAHRTRLFIVDELARGERGMRELTHIIGVRHVAGERQLPCHEKQAASR